MTHFFNQSEFRKRSNKNLVWHFNLGVEDTFECEIEAPCVQHEWMISWNGVRTSQEIKISFAVWNGKWSPLFPYAVWGREEQYTFKHHLEGVTVDQDVILTPKGVSRFRIVVNGNGGGFVKTLHLAASQSPLSLSEHVPLQTRSVKVQGLSQIALPTPHAKRICSPTSVTAVVRALLGREDIDPLIVANKSYDHRFSIFGNWVLNVAAASEYLGPSWNCWAMKLTGVGELLDQLNRESPVIVSIKGEIPGAPQLYPEGHLIVVKGFDAEMQTVQCMDPAFHKNEECCVSYPLSSFLTAWEKRGRLAYLFTHRA